MELERRTCKNCGFRTEECNIARLLVEASDKVEIGGPDFVFMAENLGVRCNHWKALQ